MYFRTTYTNEFDDLYMHLKSKYPQKLFDLDGIGKQMDMSEFSKNFFASNVTSDASIDSNANCDDVSVIAYTNELPKPFFRLNSYFILWKELRRLYGLEIANDIIEKQLSGDIYIHDFHGVAAGMPYCFNYSTYDIMTKGLPMVKKVKSLPPKHLYAFKSQLEQFTTIASNSTLGATGLADLLVVMSYYVSNILKTKSDAHFKFASEKDCWTYVKENLVSFIYTINQPMRGNQCVKETTKVLTPDGFKTYQELKVEDLIYTWGKDGKLNIQPIKAINIYDFDGEMHQYQGKDIIQTVTPNHRVFHKKNNSNEYTLTNSFNLIDEKDSLTIPVAMIKDDRIDYPISDHMLKLVVFLLTHSYTKGTKDKDEIQYCFVNLLNETTSKIPSWMYNLSKRQANIVIDTWTLVDENINSDNYNKQKCRCSSYMIAEQLQHICFLAGKGSRISNEKIGSDKKEIIYLYPYDKVDKEVSEKRKVYYKGKVWCPTTDDGVVVFKENDSIYVSGNSPFTNVSVYDEFFLEKLSEDYIFPDGSSPDKNIVKKLQELYLDIMNEELERTPLTFPVTTGCFSIDKENNINDEDFLRMIAEKNMKFGFINIYCGDSSTLSSCCRLRSEQQSEYFNSFGSGKWIARNIM